jgi:UDP-N-acetyl-D-mannosaminuronate dehydrogenase
MKNIITEIKNKFIGNKIIQLGITFKPDSDDLRDSQSLLLNELLKEEGYEIEVIDPNIFNSKQYSDVKFFSDNVLISTFHKEFKNLNFENKKVVIVGNK